MRGDTVAVGDVKFVMGESAFFKTPQEALDFYATSTEVSWTRAEYPFLWDILGGPLETKTYTGRVRCAVNGQTAMHRPG